MTVRKQVSGNVKPKNGVVVKNGSQSLIFKKFTPQVEEGAYIATIKETKIAKPVKIGQNDISRLGVVFVLEDGRELQQNFLLYCGNNYPAYQMLITVFGSIEDSDIENLIGEKVAIKIEHKEVRNNTYANVTRVFSIDEFEETFHTEQETVEEFDV